MSGSIDVQKNVNISGLFTLLEGWNESISSLVIKQLLMCVDERWPDITQYLQMLINAPSTLSEELLYSVHYLISKCYFHMQDFYNCLEYALRSGPLFNLNEESYYVKAMIDTCIDEYKEARKAQKADSEIPESILNIVNYIFSQSLNTRNVSNLVGISVECRRLDLLEASLRRTPNLTESVHILLDMLSKFPYPADVQSELLSLSRRLLEETHDWFGVLQCLLLQRNFNELPSFILNLLDRDALVAYQVCFLLYERNDPVLLHGVINSLTSATHPCIPTVLSILRGTVSDALTYKFITMASCHDSRLFEDYVQMVNYEDTNVQQAMMVAQGIANIGGTNEFVMNHINWIKKAENWTKFGIISSFALPHLFDPEKASEHLKNYLTSDKEEELGGGLYGYSILMMGRGDEASEEIRRQMQGAIAAHSDKEMIVHASALGLGLLYLGSMDMALTESLIPLLSDKPFEGFAAGVAIGLINCGCGDSVMQFEELIEDTLIPVITTTSHDRIAAGIAIGIALMFMQTGDVGEKILEKLRTHNNAYLRMSGALGTGLAHVGQHNHHRPISILLEMIARDVSDQVRRNAVIALGFIYIDSPSSFLPTVKLLIQSFNPHIRYATALIAGLISPSAAEPQLLDLLLTAMDDSEDFVAQGAALGLGVMLMETNGKEFPQSDAYRAKVLKVLRNEGFAGVKRSETVLRRQGALLGAGFLDAGGRNTSIQLMGWSGIRREAVVSVFLGCQLWEWYPFVQIMGKALVPTALLAVDESLHLPKECWLRCGQKESVFAYVEPVKKEEKSEKAVVTFSFQEKSTRAALRSSLRRSSTRGTKEKEEEESKELKELKELKEEEEAKEAKEAKETKETKEAEESKEPEEFQVMNGNRITRGQMKFLSFPKQQFEMVLDWERMRRLGMVPGFMMVKYTGKGGYSYLDEENEGEMQTVPCPQPFTYHIPEQPAMEQCIVY